MPSRTTGTASPEDLAARLAKLETEKRLIGREALNRYKELAFLYRYIEKLSAGASVEDTVVLVLEQAGALVPSENTLLMLPSAAGYQVFGTGAAATPVLGNVVGLWETAWKSGNAALLDDLDASASTGNPFLARARSTMVIPLKDSVGVVGLLSLTHPQPGVFTSEHLKLVTALGLVSALAITSAAYASEIKAHRDRLEELVAERTRDLTLANQKLQGLASQDGLTGLANRRAFDFALGSHLETCRSAGRPVGLLMLDVDHFKLYNDHYGHQGGDECLRQVSRILERTASTGVSVVARYGGEEFAVVLPGSTAAEALELGAQICRAIEAERLPHQASKVGPVVTVSIGAASLTPGPLDGPERLIAAADRGLYAAKEQGRNRAVGIA